jgi:hypothetical protein
MTAGGPGAPAAPAAATQRTFRIVISYRRVDTGGDARSLAEALESRFGNENVFLDIETIGPGEPFDQAIDRAVASSDVLLALIGQHWLTLTDDEGRRRIDDPRDVVRVEVLSALQQELLVIPVLLEDAKMPSEEDLPPDLAPLSKRNAVELRATKWKSDVESFVDDLAALRRKKLEGLGVRGGWFGEAVHGLRRAVIGNPRLAGLVTLVILLLLGGLVAALVLRDGDDGGGGGGEEPQALHPPLAADETIAFVSGGRIMLLAGDAARPAALPGDGFRTGPEWSFDGRRIAYEQAEDIWTANQDGANPRRLTMDGEDDHSPAWSEDGALVAFDRPEADDPGRRGIWVVRADGTEPPVDLQPGEEVGAAPDWSPDGREIAYQRGQRIWIMASDGTGTRPLVEDYNRPSLFPAWAPNGNRIAFVHVDTIECEIGLVDPRGGPVDILEPGRPERCGGLAWAPDGRHLVVTGKDGGLWAITRREGEATPLLEAGQAASPSWERTG